MKNKNFIIEDYFSEVLDSIEETINSTITDENIKSLLHGGKKLRSLLAQLSFKACTRGKEKPNHYKKALETGVSIELAHGASLVHDDIIDNDVVRRGKTAFHVKEGIGKALLIGHKMLAHGFDIALSHSKEAAKLYVDSWNKVVTGEIDEVDFNKKDYSSFHKTPKKQIFEAYDQIIDLKTAGLFSSACKAGALAADMSGDILRVFSSYGREIGLAYQLADDLVDLKNGEMIESVILPLLARLENKPQTGFLKKREIKKMFARNEEKIKSYYIDEIKKHVKKAEELSKSDVIPDSNYKDLMGQAPMYIINRMLAEIDILI
jgi:geranylgeranyl pyrophosphate synthase